MRLGVVGGRLQGIEAAYLGAKAGFDIVLLDRRREVPAAGLADEWHRVDVAEAPRSARSILAGCDVVLPACEDVKTLKALEQVTSELGIPLAFDGRAYATTSSKAASDRLFARLDVPRPAAWPECGFPVVVKPDGESGSHGVGVACDVREFDAAVATVQARGQRPVIQQFVSGPSLSIEVLGFGGQARAYQVTELEFDARYDCKRVIAPAKTDRAVHEILADAGRRIARGLGLRGIMDVEAMVGSDGPAVIEIDARLPSQTPTAVYHSTGVNLVELLVFAALGERPPEWDPQGSGRAAVYQHLAVEGPVGSVVGEGRFGLARRLRRIPGFFGCDEALTDYEPGARSWVTTLITTGSDVAEARAAGAACIAAIADHCRLDVVRDDSPAVPWPAPLPRRLPKAPVAWAGVGA